jgi:probable rRNA maturation factor
MFHYKVITEPSFSIDKNTLDQIFNCISSTINITQEWTLNIVFLDSDSIQKLNNDYRKKNTPTDVLSFHYFDDFSDLETTDVAWEIILSEPHIIAQGKEFGLWTEKEFYKLIIHSVLHILWCDHENNEEYKVMSELEKSIWWKVFEK